MRSCINLDISAELIFNYKVKISTDTTTKPIKFKLATFYFTSGRPRKGLCLQDSEPTLVSEWLAGESRVLMT